MKLKGWEGRLTTYLSEVAAKPFRPATLDCGLFFADAVQAMTGEDIAKPFRGKYRTIEGGIKIAQKLGFDNHVEYVASLFEELPSKLMAQRGDGVEILDVDGSPALGIVQGAGVYVMGLDGLTIHPLSSAVRAFRI
jgi:hypothetical protein